MKIKIREIQEELFEDLCLNEKELFEEYLKDYFENAEIRYYNPFDYLVINVKGRPELSYKTHQRAEVLRNLIGTGFTEETEYAISDYITNFYYYLNDKLKEKFGVELQVQGRSGGWWGIKLDDAYGLLNFDKRLFNKKVKEYINKYKNEYDNIEKLKNKIFAKIEDDFDDFIIDKKLVKLFDFIENEISKEEKKLDRYVRERINEEIKENKKKEVA